MLQLYISGQRVNLADSVRTDYYVKNPFFTNEGDFTLDIDIDMSDPQNAQVYKYLSRIERSERTSRREAVLMDEHGVLLRGQEVVLETHDNKVKIQIVGGTSELNYLMSDKTLQDLDLWTNWNSDEVVYPPVCAYNASPHAEYGLMDSPEYVTENNVKTLMWRIINKPEWRQSDNALVPSYERGQPYYWAIVNRVIAALGFEVGTNVLQTDARYNKVIMIHAYRSSYIAEQLPNWTVSQFFDEIQKFFNVIISVDKTTHTVNVVHAWDFFNDSDMEVIDHRDVVNFVEKTFDNDSDMTMVDYSAAHYGFTDKLLNKYAAISQSLIDVCNNTDAEIVTNARVYDKNYLIGIWKAIEGDEDFLDDTEPTTAVESEFGNRTIFHQVVNGEDKMFVLWTNEEEYTALKLVNQFGPKESIDPSATDVEMKIVPVRMVSSPLQGDSSSSPWWQYPLPAVDGEASGYGQVQWGGSAVTRTEADNINDDIKSGYDEEAEEKADVMFAAYYLGVLPIDWEDEDFCTLNGLTVPVASPDELVQLHRLGTDGDDLFWKTARLVQLGSDGLTMAIVGTYGMNAYSYSLNPTVQTATEYNIRFRSIINHDVRKVWLIGNRKFYCKELKYDISAGRRSEIVEGTFFPIVKPGEDGSGEAVYYIRYSLSRVIVGSRVNSVMANESLHLDLSMSGGGNASWVIYSTVTMGGVDVTADVFVRTGRTATIDIAAVTGDVVVKAWVGEYVPTYTVSGVVKNSNNIAIIGATVTLGSRSTVSGDDGSYSFPYVEAGTYTVTASKDGYRNYSSSVTVASADVTKDISMAFDVATYTVSGYIRDTNGGVAAATVSIGNIVVTSRPTGAYYISGLEAGTYSMMVYANNHLTLHTTVTVSGDMTKNIILQETYTVSGVVTDSNGNALSGVQVTLDDDVTNTNSDGEYSFSDIEAGTYTLGATKEGYTFDSISITVNDDVTQNITMGTAAYTVSGIVTDGENPLVGVNVELAGETYLTGLDGAFTFTNVLPGTYTLSATKSEYTSVSTPIAVSSNMTQNLTMINIIEFADPTTKSICVSNWGGGTVSGEITPAEAAAVTNIGTTFKGTSITSFDEFEYFVGCGTLAQGAFQNCANLTRLIMPNSITSIGWYAFSGCSSLTSLIIPNGVTSLSGRAVENCTDLTSVTIGNKVTSIPNYCFNGCSSLATVNILGNVTSIGYSSFGTCSSLASISLPASLTSIGAYGFYKTGLTSIVLGQNMSSIGNTAFNSCSSLASVTVEATTPPTLGAGVFAANASGRKIYVPSASVSDYQAASNWSSYASDIESIS